MNCYNAAMNVGRLQNSRLLHERSRRGLKTDEQNGRDQSCA